MAINLNKHRESLLAAWKDVLDDKSKTDWALFGYEGQSNDLKVVGKGTGGIEEMIDDFNSGKIMYAYCKVMDPTTSLPKCVLINWQGEGAPIVRKGTCANHIRDVGNLFKGAHVTLHARNEEEVDPQLIIDKVAKSTGSAYSFKERGELETGSGSGPVGTSYKRVVPQQEINSKERDKFWEKEETEEKQRQAEERQRRDVERMKLEDERKQRELAEAALREQKIQARSQTITQQREAEKHAEEARVEKPYQDERAEDDERKGRSDILRRQRSQEAQSVISKRTFDARAIFEQNTSAGQMHQSRRASLNQQARSAVTSPPAAAQAQPELANGRKASLPTWPPSSPEPQNLVPEPQNPCTEPNVPSPVVTKNGILKQTTQPQYEPYSSLSPTEESYEPERPAGNGISNPIYASNPINDVQNESIVKAVPYSPCNPSHANTTYTGPVEVVKSPAEQKKVVFQEPEEQQYEDISYSDQPAQSQYPEEAEQEWAVGTEENLNYNGADELGLQARALYDYQAADATELTFDPGDIITHIDQIDEGWWQGLGPDGIFGLFPANYVELINV